MAELPSLLLLSEVPPRPDQSGGSVVLWRHMQRLQRIHLRQPRQALSRPRRWWSILQTQGPRLRLQRLLLILQPLLLRLGTRLDPHQVGRVRREYRAILTVANGTRWLEAMALARATGLPLATIFYDWYPDASGCTPGCRLLWDLAFRELHRRSALAFYVSEGMARELGPHPHALVLPPIPADPGPPAPSHPSSRYSSTPVLRGPRPSRINLYYSGLAGGLYRFPLQALMQAVGGDHRFRLHISGSESDTLGPLEPEAPVRLSGFLDGQAWREAFAEADVLLVVLPFEPGQRRHLRTHFPSKLIEYANRRKPIAIWGPACSSAALWASGDPHALAVSDPEPQALLDALARWLPGLAPAPRDLRFDPDRIHHCFESALERLVQEA